MPESILRDYRSEPRDAAAPKRLYIAFHGYGSSGEAMRQCLTASLQDIDPGAVLRCPDGPIEVKDGYSWCHVDEIDFKTPTPERMAQRIAARNPERSLYVQRVTAEEQVSPANVILFGFSLGATGAVSTGLSLKDQVAGIFSWSGGALDCIEDIKSHPSMVIAAGAKDDQRPNSYYCGVPHSYLAQSFMQAHGIAVERLSLPGIDHDVCDDAGRMLGEFGKRVTLGQSHLAMQYPIYNAEHLAGGVAQASYAP